MLPAWTRPRPAASLAVAAATTALLTAPQSRAAPPPSQYHGLRPVQPTPLSLDQESIVVHCPPAHDTLRCNVSAHYVLSNPAQEPAESDAPVVSTGIADVRVAQDGRPLDVKPWALHVRVPAGGTTTIDVSFTLSFASSVPGLESTGEPATAMQARHPLLGGDTRNAPAHPVFFHWSKGWSGSPQRFFDVRYPAGWKLHGSQWRAQGAVTQRSVARELAASDTPIDVDLRKAPPAVPIVPGGPVVAAGSAISQGFRMRYGYELGVFDWMLPAINADVDYAGLLVLTPSVEYATAARLPVPSLSAGVGLPVRLRPDSRAGARFKLSAVMVAGIEATFDYYPSDRDWETTLAARLSL